MKDKKLQKLLEETLQEKKNIENFMEDIEIPQVEESLALFKKNLEKEETTNRREKNMNKNKFRKYGLVAALALVVAVPTVSHMKSKNSPDIPKTNVSDRDNSGGTNVQIPNPLKDFETIKEAEEYAGFSLDDIPNIPSQYERSAIIGIDGNSGNKLIRIIYSNKDGSRLLFEKYKDGVGIKTDWEQYDKTEEIKSSDKTITLSSNETTAKGEWINDGFKYVITLTDNEESSSELKRILEN